MELQRLRPAGRERPGQPRAPERQAARRQVRQTEDEIVAGGMLRGQLLALIDGHGAHLPFDAAVADFPGRRHQPAAQRSTSRRDRNRKAAGVVRVRSRPRVPLARALAMPLTP
jgi:hypothetical protein